MQWKDVNFRSLIFVSGKLVANVKKNLTTIWQTKTRKVFVSHCLIYFFFLVLISLFSFFLQIINCEQHMTVYYLCHDHDFPSGTELFLEIMTPFIIM